MDIVKGSIPPNAVLAIGKFEGLHLGHQALLREVKNRAKAIGAKSAVMVFEPHPYVFFVDPAYKPLFTHNERSHIFEGLGIDYLVYFPFDREFAAMPPADFCRLLFTDCKHVMVGENYKFGSRRTGDVALMRREAEAYGAQVQTVSMEKIPAQNIGTEGMAPQAISTSHIRGLLSAGGIAEANALLGYPFFIMEKTAKGKQLGRTIGFPTLNIYPAEDKFLPADGVYDTNTVIDGKNYRGITNIGLRPTVNSESKVRSVETHLFDYPFGDRELYDTPIKVELTKFIRPEQQFTSLDELKAQLAKDILLTKEAWQA
ncbi:MAG: riboflavin biosynthesis protein RibF [Defluviitaleaceae bacterium]|nr:riboflavin biosynthesis protein RibF [Defluviitaleaceae bacterium]